MSSISVSQIIKEYESLSKGFVETQSMPAPQFYHREKCGCTFLHSFSNGIWYTNDKSHRSECNWRTSI
jgi:hypothetical protein